MLKSSRLSLGVVRLACLALALAGHGALFAAPPTATVIFPAGGRAGEAVTLAVTGKLEPWPAQVWCSEPGITFKPGQKAGEYEATIAASVRPGACLVRFHNAEGATDPFPFVTGLVPELTEIEPNSALESPQPVASLPVTINGKLDQAQDADLYRVSLKKGQTLIASVESYSIGAPIDPLVQIFDPEGGLLAFAHDNGVNLDPEIAFAAPADGDYIVALMGFVHPPGSDINFTSNARNIYRLTLTTGPWLKGTAPPRIQKEKTQSLQVLGWNLPGKDPTVMEHSLSTPPTEPELWLTIPGSANTLRVPVTTFPVFLESSEASPPALSSPASVHGFIGRPKETDHYPLTAKKGETLRLRVLTHAMASPMDPVLVVQDAQGKELKRADDIARYYRDADLVWTAPADGGYRLAVSDLFGKAGPAFRYELLVEPAEADFRGTLASSALVLQAGKTIELKLKFERLNGHKTPLAIEIPALPAGVSFEPPVFPEKPGDLTVTLKAAEEAPPFSGPIQVFLKETEGDAPKRRELVFSFQDAASTRGPKLIDETPALWLAVTAAAK